MNRKREVPDLQMMKDYLADKKWKLYYDGSKCSGSAWLGMAAITIDGAYTEYSFVYRAYVIQGYFDDYINSVIGQEKQRLKQARAAELRELNNIRKSAKSFRDGVKESLAKVGLDLDELDEIINMHARLNNLLEKIEALEKVYGKVADE